MNAIAFFVLRLEVATKAKNRGQDSGEVHFHFFIVRDST
jgi:hypothetical protein